MSDLMKPGNNQDLTEQDDVMTKQGEQIDDVGSRLKRELMAAMLDDPKPVLAKGESPRVILALVNYRRSIWDQATVLQADMFREAAGTGLEMKFAYYGPEVAGGVRTERVARLTSDDVEAPELLVGGDVLRIGVGHGVQSRPVCRRGRRPRRRRQRRS